MSRAKPARALLVFVDGIGFGRRGPQNPFDGTPLDVLAPLGDPSRATFPGAHLTAVDASLGHPGLPQSATGQATIFTGRDAIAVAGGHTSGHPTRALRELVTRDGFLGRARERGQHAAFLNAYDTRRAEHLAHVVAGREARNRRFPPSTSSVCALANGGALRTFDEVERGVAATFDLTGELLRAAGVDAPQVSIVQAARHVAAGAAENELALFEMFLTDYAGHSQDTEWARDEAVRTDRFLAELFASIDSREQLVVVTSDHGNMEDLSVRTHTRAPVPLLAYGAGAAEFTRGAESLLDVAPRLLAATDARGLSRPGDFSRSRPDDTVSRMTDAPPDPKYLEMFPAWLRSLGEDAGALGAIVSSDAGEPVKRHVVAGLNYIFKSLDLIPDGIDDLGFMDDAFVLRVAAALACDADAAARTGVLERLAMDAGEVREFLGADYTRLETYVNGLQKGAARGRTVDDILEDESQRKEFVHEVAAWAKDYQGPTFTRDPKTLLKLKSFLNAKLP